MEPTLNNMINWDKKSTKDLELILGSLVRFEHNAKTDRERARTAKNISEITRILNERNK